MKIRFEVTVSKGTVDERDVVRITGSTASLGQWNVLSSVKLHKSKEWVWQVLAESNRTSVQYIIIPYYTVYTRSHPYVICYYSMCKSIMCKLPTAHIKFVGSHAPRLLSSCEMCIVVLLLFLPKAWLRYLRLTALLATLVLFKLYPFFHSLALARCRQDIWSVEVDVEENCVQYRFMITNDLISEAFRVKSWEAFEEPRKYTFDMPTCECENLLT